MIDYRGLNVLVGHNITSIELARDKKAIRFLVVGRNPIIFYADGDCCSDTWIEHIEGVERLIGALVTSIEEINMPHEDERDGEYGDVTTFYGLAINTDKGTAVIDYRNSSNGYYGGSLVCKESNQYYYGGVFGQNNTEGGFEPLTRSI